MAAGGARLREGERRTGRARRWRRDRRGGEGGDRRRRERRDHPLRSRMSRTVDAVFDGTRTLEGGGFLVTRPFPTARMDHFDPFLLLDQMGPVDVPPGEAKGAP